jgi:hypothetical protein
MPTPFAPWKTLCETVRRWQRKIYFRLVDETEERVAQGYENGCFMEQVRALDAPHQSEFIINEIYYPLYRFFRANLSLG